MKNPFVGERFFNRISQIPVLKKWMIRDIIVTHPFYFEFAVKSKWE